MQKNTFRFAALAILWMAASTAHAEPWQCVAPSIGQTLPLSDIVRKVEASGISNIVKIERKGSCYELKARNAMGRVKFYVKSTSGEIVREQERF